jgi:hypothetical protein
MVEARFIQMTMRRILHGSFQPFGTSSRENAMHSLLTRRFEAIPATKLHSHRQPRLLGLHRQREPILRALPAPTIINLILSSEALGLCCSSSRKVMLIQCGLHDERLVLDVEEAASRTR